jgi:hypothetical protein
MRNTPAKLHGKAICEMRLTAEEEAVVSRYPPVFTLKPEPGAIRAAAERLKAKPGQAHVEAAYHEAVEFGEYWAEVYEDLRRHGIAALNNYYEDSDFWEVDSALEALDAVLWALRSDIERARRDQQAMELKYALRHGSRRVVPLSQMALF